MRAERQMSAHTVFDAYCREFKPLAHELAVVVLWLCTQNEEHDQSPGVCVCVWGTCASAWVHSDRAVEKGYVQDCMQ